MRVEPCLVVLISLLAGGGCGGQAPAGGPGQAVGTGTVSLTVGAPIETASVQASPNSYSAQAPSGSDFLEVPVTLTNVDAAIPIPLAAALYTLTTDSSLVLMAAPDASLAVDSPCDDNASLAMGGRFGCTVVFQMATGTRPVSITYDDQKGDRVTATLPTPSAGPPATNGCLGPGAPSGASSACSACLQQTQTCPEERNTFATACQACTQMCANATDCTCAVSCAQSNPDCAQAWQTMLSCVQDSCSTICQ